MKTSADKYKRLKEKKVAVYARVPEGLLEQVKKYCKTHKVKSIYEAIELAFIKLVG